MTVEQTKNCDNVSPVGQPGFFVTAYCPQHMPGIDPQAWEFYQSVYGWKMHPCTLPHDVPVVEHLSPWPLILYLTLPFLLHKAFPDVGGIKPPAQNQ